MTIETYLPFSQIRAGEGELYQDKLERVLNAQSKQVILPPILVREILPHTYVILDGQHRAVTQLIKGASTTPCIIAQTQYDKITALQGFSEAQVDILNSYIEFRWDEAKTYAIAHPNTFAQHVTQLQHRYSAMITNAFAAQED